MSIIKSRWNESVAVGAGVENKNGRAYLRYDPLAKAFILGLVTYAGPGDKNEIEIPDYIIKEIQNTKFMYHSNKKPAGMMDGWYPWE